MGSNTPMTQRVGETNRAKNGLMMTIIAYRNFEDIDIQFEDGYLVFHRSYGNFRKGNIHHPDYVIKRKASTDRTGETNIARNGMKITIINYRKATDFDVQFEDGAIVKHQNYRMFSLGKIKHPDKNKQAKRKSSIKLGETRLATIGLMMTIIGITDYDHLTIKFEDGTEVDNISYTRFKSGAVAYPGYRNTRHYLTCKARLGESRKNTQGLNMTIIEYSGSQHATIKFDDGTILYNQAYQSFRNGNIRNPNYIPNMHIGESICNNQGLNMTIIAYRNANDIDLKFDDGTIIYHRQYTAFLNRGIRHPTYCQYLGKTVLSNEGLLMEIIGYNGHRDMAVKYETGYIAEHRNKDYFDHGFGKHPFPWIIGNMSMDKPAYVVGNTGNFYCHCTKCGITDIMTISEMKSHICQ